MLRRIGAVGDIHAEDERLAAVLRFLDGQDLDLTVAVGDIVDGEGSAERCCQLLEAYGVEAVRGNHDRWALELPSNERSRVVDSYLRSLPATREYDTARGRILLCHGLKENDMNRLTPDDYGYALETNTELQALMAEGRVRLGISGHTHRRMVKSFGGLTVINVGTLARNHDPCFAVVDFTTGAVQFFDVDSDRVTPASVHSL